MGQCMQDYKCLYTAVTICATLFVPKFGLSILTPLASKSRSNWKCSLDHVRYTHDPNVVTTGQQVAEIIQVQVFL